MESKSRDSYVILPAKNKNLKNGLVLEKLFDDDSNSRIKQIYCCGFSFMTMAIIQGLIVIGLQIAISVLGGLEGSFQFRESHVLLDHCSCEALPLYRDELRDRGSESLLNTLKNISSDSDIAKYCEEVEIMNTFTANRTGSSISNQLGIDKQFYIFFFIGILVYNTIILVISLRTKNIIGVYFFLLLNFLQVLYSFLQVYQFRNFDSTVGLLSIGYIALANALVLMIFTVVFALFTFAMHKAFGWWIFTWFRLSSDGNSEENPPKTHSSQLRFYYRNYQIAMQTAQLVILFSICFFVAELVLLLHVCDWEYWFTVCITIVLPGLLLLGYIAVRNENIILTLLLQLIIFLGIVFYIFKIVRFALRNCPVCLIISFTDMHLGISERSQSFEHLVLFAVINLIACVVLFVLIIIVELNYYRGLKDHFYKTWKNKTTLYKILDLAIAIPFGLRKVFCYCFKKYKE